MWCLFSAYCSWGRRRSCCWPVALWSRRVRRQPSTVQQFACLFVRWLSSQWVVACCGSCSAAGSTDCSSLCFGRLVTISNSNSGCGCHSCCLSLRALFKSEVAPLRRRAFVGSPSRVKETPFALSLVAPGSAMEFTCREGSARTMKNSAGARDALDSSGAEEFVDFFISVPRNRRRA